MDLYGNPMSINNSKINENINTWIIKKRRGTLRVIQTIKSFNKINPLGIMASVN